MFFLEELLLLFHYKIHLQNQTDILVWVFWCCWYYSMLEKINRFFSIFNRLVIVVSSALFCLWFLVYLLNFQLVKFWISAYKLLSDVSAECFYHKDIVYVQYKVDYYYHRGIWHMQGIVTMIDVYGMHRIYWL